MAADSRRNNVASYAIFTLQKCMHFVAKDNRKSPRGRPRRRCENIALGRWVVMIEKWMKLAE